MILTWGLIGPGKGIEFAIEAMAELRHLTPRPTYVVMGETHPKIVQASGEAYRESLVARARELGIEEMVQFEDGYRDTAAILARIRDADLILLPYLSRDQVVSGVLVEAIASGKPVVSTAFPHAVELLGAGSGTVVPHEDAGAIASALRAYLTEPGKAARATAVARRQAPTLFWENVGEAYDRLAAEIVDHRIRAAR
jgi:glycosyltransferase involved in cell wall biosynthesis